ncbi:hypothetical protein C8R47DRAFT_1195119 [Mycena vitilis]|nr:hypothetical protein C8R47DRAFT_1195119 [Mycena vitilis]
MARCTACLYFIIKSSTGTESREGDLGPRSPTNFNLGVSFTANGPGDETQSATQKVEAKLHTPVFHEQSPTSLAQLEPVRVEIKFRSKNTDFYKRLSLCSLLNEGIAPGEERKDVISWASEKRIPPRGRVGITIFERVAFSEDHWRALAKKAVTTDGRQDSRRQDLSPSITRKRREDIPPNSGHISQQWTYLPAAQGCSYFLPPVYIPRVLTLRVVQRSGRGGGTEFCTVATSAGTRRTSTDGMVLPHKHATGSAPGQLHIWRLADVSRAMFK